MAKLEALLEEYGANHGKPVNKLLHALCVPLIVWAVVALVWSIPFPFATGDWPVPLNWAMLALAPVMIWYVVLSPRLAVGLALYLVFMIQLTVLLEQSAPRPLWQIAAALFVLGWVGQFVGHVVEGKRPSFFTDLRFLLIGPAWLMAGLYRAVGLKY